MPVYHKPLLPFGKFLFKVFRYFAYSFMILGFSLGIGMLGYSYYGRLGWVDALLNASMILTGMGPVNEMHTDAAKIFASCYALYSGIAFLSTVAVLLTPIIHRFFHRVHLEFNEQEDDQK